VSTPEKVAVITGGGSGIGRACAEALAARGYRTVCCGLDRDDDAPPELEFVRLDVTDRAAYQKARPELGAAWRRQIGEHYPAMTLLEVKGLLAEGAVVELQGLAVLP